MTATAEAQGGTRPLPPIAAKVDRALVDLDAQVDWLTALSPIHNDALWDAFEASGRRHVPPLEYHPLGTDLHDAREALLALPVEDIESPLLQGRTPDVRNNVRYDGGGHFPEWLYSTYGDAVCAISLEYKKVFMDEWSGQADIGALYDMRDGLRAAVAAARPELSA